MTKYWKKILISICILIMISLSVSIVLTKHSTKNTLNLISAIDMVSENIVLVNNMDNRLIISKVDTQGNEISSIYYPIEKNQIYNNCLDLFTVDNNVYIHMVMLNSSNGTIFEEKVLLCDFDNNNLIEKWDIPTSNTDFEQVAFGTTVINDNLYYISQNDDDTINLNKIDTLNKHSVEKKISLKENSIIDWAIFQDLSIIGYSSYQGIIDFSNGTPEKIYPLENTDCSLVNFDYTSNGNIYISDLLDNKNIVYDIYTKNFEKYPISTNLDYNIISLNDNTSKKDTLKYSTLKKISYIDNTDFVAVCDANKNYNQIALFQDGTLSVIDSIHTKSINTKIFFGYFGILFLILSLITLIISTYIYLEKYISITLKISILSGIILIVGINFILTNIKTTLQDNIKNDVYSILLNNISLNQNDIASSLYYGYDYNSIKDIIHTENFSDLKDRNIRENNLVMSPYYSLHILNDDGTLITKNNNQEMENVPTEYIYSKSVVDMYIESIKSNTSITMVQKDSLGEWYVLTYPIIIECADGTIIQAVVETGIEKYIVNSDISKYCNSLTVLLVISLTTLIIITMIILWISLKPLKTLRLNIKNNRIELKDNKKSFYKNEIIEIKDILEHMIANITNYKQEIENNSNMYQKLIPYSILNMLNSSDKESILELKAGDSKKMFLYNTYLNLDIHDNTSYNNIIEIFEKNHGIIEDFNLNSMEVSFINNPKDILNTIIRISQQYKDINIGLSYGTSIPAIIGGNSRLETIIISRQKNVAEMLSKIGKKFNINIVISENFLKHIPNYNELYSTRLIGHIKIDSNYTKIYQILDVSSKLKINLATKLDFEDGINSFINKDFINAKRYFVKVLKINKDDEISKEYLNMCDTYLNKQYNIHTDILYNIRSDKD